jgi:repressor LexA
MKVMATNIKRFLNLNNMERMDLSELIGEPYTTVCSWITEKNYPRIDKIEKMAQVFGISKADLVEEQNAANENLTISKKGLRKDEVDLLTAYNLMDFDMRELALNQVKSMSNFNTMKKTDIGATS